MLKWSGLLSLALGGLVVLAEPWWNYASMPDFSLCQIVDPRTTDVAFVALTVACLGISFGSFVFVLAKERDSSNAVHRRTVIRSAAYMVKTVIIVCPVVLGVLLFFVFGLRPMVLQFSQVANTLQDLNGVANAMTYFLLSRYSRRGVLDHTAPAQESFHVAFDEEVGVNLYKESTLSTTSSDSSISNYS